jgi:L-asparaginase
MDSMRLCSLWLIRLILGLAALALTQAAQAATPRVVVLATGGTIASGTNEMLAGQVLVAELKLDDHVEVEIKDVARVGSSNLNRGDWARLVAAIRSALMDPAVAGIVVTHGTDTMEETAFFLDLVIDDPRPIVVTGSMRSSDSLSADGPANLRTAIAVASDIRARDLGTLVVLDDQIHAAAAATKTDTNRLSAFVSVDSGPLGIVGDGQPHFLSRPFAKHPRWSLDPAKITKLSRVEIVTAAFDGDDLLLESARRHGAKAIVIAAFGSGTMTEAMRDFVEKHSAALPLIVSARVQSGFVKSAYGGGTDDPTRGAIRSGRLNAVKSRILVMTALAAGVPVNQALFDAF